MSHASGGPDDPSAPTPEDWEQTRVDPVTFAPPTGEPYGTPQFVWPDQQAWAPPSEPWAPPGPPWAPPSEPWAPPSPPWAPPSEPWVPPLTREEAAWMPRAHWIGLLTHWVGPLVVLLTVGARSERVREEAVESLNWELTVAIGLAASAALLFVGVGLYTAAALLVCSVVFHLRGAQVAASGRHYRYPLAVRLVR